MYLSFSRGDDRYCWDEDAQQLWIEEYGHPKLLPITFAHLEKFVPMGITKRRRTRRKPKWVPAE